MYIVQDPASHIPGNLSGKSRRTKPLRPDQEEHINSRGQSATEEGGMLTSCPPFGQRADTSSGRKAPGSNAGHPPKGAAGDGRTCVRPEKSDARRGDGPSFRPPAKDRPGQADLHPCQPTGTAARKLTSAPTQAAFRSFLTFLFSPVFRAFRTLIT